MDLPAGADPRRSAWRQGIYVRFRERPIGMVGDFLVNRSAVVTCTNEKAGLGSTIPKRLIAVSGIVAQPEPGRPSALSCSGAVQQVSAHMLHHVSARRRARTDIVLSMAAALALPTPSSGRARLHQVWSLHACLSGLPRRREHGWIYGDRDHLSPSRVARYGWPGVFCGACRDRPVKIDAGNHPAGKRCRAVRAPVYRSGSREALRLASLALGRPRAAFVAGKRRRARSLRDWAAPGATSADQPVDCMKGMTAMPDQLARASCEASGREPGRYRAPFRPRSGSHRVRDGGLREEIPRLRDRESELTAAPATSPPHGRRTASESSVLSSRWR